MKKLTLPISLLYHQNKNSLAEARAHLAARERAGSKLLDLEHLKERLDDLNAFALGLDDGPEDYAAHRKGLVLLVEHRMPKEMNTITMTGEVHANESGKLTSSELHLDERVQSRTHEHLTYKKSGPQETYRLKKGAYKEELVIDHAKGTLTYFQTGD